MSVEKAQAHYLGKSGHKKLNCAQTILNAFKDKYNLTDEVIDQFSGNGGGRSPEGQCGSLYAAKYILERAHPARIKDCEDALLSCAGSVKCREIRALGKLSCLGCVEKMASFIDRV